MELGGKAEEEAEESLCQFSSLHHHQEMICYLQQEADGVPLTLLFVP